MPATPLPGSAPRRVMLMSKVPYLKPSLSVEQQLEFLKKRHLIIEDPAQAAQCLQFVTYHRLSNYFSPFEEAPHHSESPFKAGSRFEDIWRLYLFDRQLRLLISDPIERIEVAFRTLLVNELGDLYGSHWHMNADLFKDPQEHDKWIKALKKSLHEYHHDPVIRRYYQQYESPELPPIWQLMEVIPLGACSKLFSNLKKLKDKKQVCVAIKLHPTVIDSWLRAITYTRNLCAHHARVWNRWFVIAPKGFIRNFTRNTQPFLQQAYVLAQLSKQIDQQVPWKKALFQLLQAHETFISIEEMGFDKNWQSDPFWSE